MIVNLTENRFLQQVPKIELINWDWFGIHHAAQTNPFLKCRVMAISCQKMIFHIWVWTSSFWCKPYFERPFHCVSPLKFGEGRLFSKKCFSRWDKFCGSNLWGIILHGGTNDRVLPRRKEFHKMHFPVIWLWAL